MNKHRYGMRKYMDDDSVMYEVIDIYEREGERKWLDAMVIGDDAGHLVATIQRMADELRNLTQPDVTTTLYEWWWTDTPDVKYSTGVREDDEETERVCEGV